jgi:nicotinate phosphoribosyltransferase
MNLLTSALLTDLYQLTMMQAYVDKGMHEEAVFEFYVRSLPKRRGFLVADGLETLLTFLEGMRFSDEEMEYLAGTGIFSRGLLDYVPPHFRELKTKPPYPVKISPALLRLTKEIMW